MKSLVRFTLLAALASSAALPASAADVNPLADRESKVPPVVYWLQSQGVKLTFLGEEGGLRGYLGESANGKMQTFYVAPDGKHVIAGILFKNGGTNITGVQIGEMRARFDAAASDFGAATVNGSKIEPAPKASSSPVAAEPDPAPPASAPADAKEPEGKPAAAGTAPSLPALPAPEAPSLPAPGGEAPAKPEAAAVSLPEAKGPVAGAKGNPSELWISKIDKAEFLEAANKTPFFEVGTLNAPATLWMVADPQCPYCHKAWDYLRPLVYDKKIKIRVILIAGLPGSEPLARDLLSRPLPARTWLDSDAGTNLKLEADQKSPEWEKAGEFLSMNMDFARKFGVDRTPFLGYTAEDGQFYSALGLPSDLESFLSAASLQ